MIIRRAERRGVDSLINDDASCIMVREFLI